MEFGPRALGARSILGDARNPEMQSKMNLKIKFASPPPFAPAVPRESCAKYFDLTRRAPTCCWSLPCARSCAAPEPAGADERFGIDRLNLPRSSIPAVTHAHFGARADRDGGQSPVLRLLRPEARQAAAC